MAEIKVLQPAEEDDKLVCEGWKYCYDNNWTNIFNANGQKVITFYKKLNYEQVQCFKAGFETGIELGKVLGKKEKGEEIAKILKL